MLNFTWNLIGRNKMRSFLTMLGIIIGIMAVIIIMATGAGAQSLIINQIKSQGTNIIGVLPGKASKDSPPASVLGIAVTSLKYEDIKSIMSLKNSPLLFGTAYVRGSATITSNENYTDTTFVGTTEHLLEIENTKVAQGRFFNSEEESSLARVIILGDEVAKELFYEENPIGKKVKIKKITFTVIGVMEKRGSVGFQNQDDQVFIPISTAQKLLLGIDYVSMARFKVDDSENVGQAMNLISDKLRELHNLDYLAEDDFTVSSMAQGLDSLTQITNALRLFLTFVAAIALLVGGIGIMNIMLATVEERTREIGLRKALGAGRKNIVLQFLIETVMITVIGGLIGIFLGVLVSYLVAKVAQNLGYDWDFIISFSSIILACLVSISVGLIFGILPARKASLLDPIEALRYE